MRYKNTVTGAIVDSASVVKGKNWELVEEAKTETNEDVNIQELDDADEELQEQTESDEDVDLQELNKDQLSKMLEEQGIDYKAKDTKDELIRLLTEE